MIKKHQKMYINVIERGGPYLQGGPFLPSKVRFVRNGPPGPNLQGGSISDKTVLLYYNCVLMV